MWTASPALATGLALGIAPQWPLLLAAVLMAGATGGMWTLPAGWEADERDRGGESLARTLLRGWPIYITGAAAMSLLALAELVLPALLEQRSIPVGWAGPLLAGFSIASAAGAAGYGWRSHWPGSLRAQSLVLLTGVTGCVTIVALAGSLPWLLAALLVAGLLAAGVNVTRNLSLREALPQSAHAAAYSVLYAAIGLGYAGSAVLAGAVQATAPPSVAVLAGVGFTVLLIAASAWGELRERRPAAAPADQRAGS